MNTKTQKINQLLRKRKQQRQKVERYRNKRIRSKYNKLLEGEREREREELGDNAREQGTGQRQAEGRGKGLGDARKIDFYNQVFGSSGDGKNYQRKQNKYKGQLIQKDQDEQQEYIRNTFITKKQTSNNKIEQKHSQQQQPNNQNHKSKIQNKNIIQYRINTDNLNSVRDRNKPNPNSKPHTNSPKTFPTSTTANPSHKLQSTHPIHSNQSTQSKPTHHTQHKPNQRSHEHNHNHQTQEPDRQQRLKLKAQKLKDRKKKFIKKMHVKNQRGQPVMRNYVKYALAKLEEGIVRDRIKGNSDNKGNGSSSSGRKNNRAGKGAKDRNYK